MASSGFIEEVSLSVDDLRSIKVNFSVPLRDSFFVFGPCLAWWYWSYLLYDQYGVDIDFEWVFYWFQPCYAFALIFVVGECHVPRMLSKSYWMTSEIASEFRIIVMTFSDPSSVSLAFTQWGTKLQKLVQFYNISGRLGPKMIPIFVCFPH